MSGILSLIGRTPLVELKHLSPNPGVQLYGKLEGQNPGGSVKDRAAYSMIKNALDRGDIGPGTQLVEATSGNTGIALAMIARLFGLNITLIMPDNATQERIQTMKAFGAELILTPAEKTIEYSRLMAEDLASRQGYFLLDQFANPDNWRAHYQSTGPEIWRDTQGKVTHFVSAMGTTGTIMGVSTYLKEQNPDIQIVGVQPSEGANIAGIRRWSADFTPAIYQRKKVDTILEVSQAEAEHMARTLAREEAVFSGVSSGGAVTAACRLAESLEEGLIVCIICDRGDRYLSSGLFNV
jgi:S-sulfo-L-cysteine synthase (O-acetyl-L-serine-dependent)